MIEEHSIPLDQGEGILSEAGVSPVGELVWINTSSPTGSEHHLSQVGSTSQFSKLSLHFLTVLLSSFVM